MQHTQSGMLRALSALCLLLLLAHAASALTVDLGEYTVRNPKISATYSKPVHLDTRTLKMVDGTIVTLCQDPKSEQTTYVTQYELYTKTGASDGSCTETGTNQELQTGNYILILQASDQGTLSTSDVINFRVQGLRIKILSTLATPTQLISPTAVAHVSFVTTKLSPTQDAGIEPPVVASVCKYGTQPGTYATLPGIESSAPRTSHAIDIDYRGDLYIACKESGDAGQEATFKLNIVDDLTKPVIAATITPQLVASTTDGLGRATVHIDTDDRAFCNITSAGGESFSSEDEHDFNTYVKSHDDLELTYDPNVVGATPQTFTYNVRCKNIAGLVNTTAFGVRVNFGDEVTLAVIEPQPLLRKGTFNLVVKPFYYPDPSHIPLDECYVNDDGTRRQDRRMVKTSEQLFNMSMSLPDGEAELKVSCYGRKTASVSYNVTIDSTPPTAPELNASEFICNNTLSATFASEDESPVSYRYSVRDQAGSLERGTTTAERFSFTPSRAISGQVRWAVNATDAMGNTGESTTVSMSVRKGTEEECGLPPFITLRGPNLGFALKTPYAFEIGTRESAVCRYATKAGVPWESKMSLASDDGLVHAVDTPTRTSATVYVSCNDTDGVMHSKSYAVGVDASAPKMTVTIDPNPVIDPRSKLVLMRVTTDDYAFCTYNDNRFGSLPAGELGAYTLDHSAALNFNNITDTDKHEFSYDITCTNLAFLNTTLKRTVIVDLGTNFLIQVLSPPPYTAAADVILKVQPNKLATCTYAEPNGTEQEFEEENNTFNADLGSLPERSYQFLITCNAANAESMNVSEFTVDRSQPQLSNLRGPKMLCEIGKFYFNISGADQEPLISYSLNATLNYSTTDALIKVDPTKLASGQYTLRAMATNHAGTKGAQASIEFTVGNETECTAPGNHCANGVLDIGEENIDCGGTCDACSLCADDSECGALVCSNGACVPQSPIVNTTVEVNDTGIIDAPCASDDECPGGICVLGECRDKPGTTPEVIPEETPSETPEPEQIPEQAGHLLSYVLIFLGIAVMGGAGYFLYEQNLHKHTGAPQMTVGQLSPAMEQRYEQNPEQRKAALDAAYAKLQAEKAKREAMFTRFNQESAQRVEAKAAAKPTKSDEYVDLSAIKTKKKEDSFDELERLNK